MSILKSTLATDAVFNATPQRLRLLLCVACQPFGKLLGIVCDGARRGGGDRHQYHICAIVFGEIGRDSECTFLRVGVRQIDRDSDFREHVRITSLCSNPVMPTP